MADAATNLVGTILGAGAGGAWDVATVTATPGGNRVTVNLDGAVVTIPKLRSYAPAVGDVALLGRIGAGLFAVGAVG